MNKCHLLVCLLLVGDYSYANDCNPAPRNVAKLEAISSSWHTVKGDLAEFNICDRSVTFDRPSKVEKPALMIIVHGGGGRGKDVETAAYYFQKLGMATLIFDSYQMNNLTMGYRFFLSQVTNEARQRMIFKVTYSAYAWALQQKNIDVNRIYFWGVSNGASVVVSMADMVSAEHVKGIFAEGLPPNGLGLPESFKTPIYLAYGEADNYGIQIEKDQKQWSRDGTCNENSDVGDLTNKNSRDCNASINSEKTIETVEAWYQRMLIKNQPIEMKIYKDAAHDFFLNGPIGGTLVKNGKVTGATTGASSAARDEYLADVAKIVEKSK